MSKEIKEKISPTEILYGKPLIEGIKVALKERISLLGFPPILSIIMAGNNPASQVYVENKAKFAKEIGAQVNIHCFPEDCQQHELEHTITQLNCENQVNGIIVQLPLPDLLNASEIVEKIDHRKDVDGLTQLNQGGLLIGNEDVIIPATPKGIIKILDFYDIDLDGKKVVVVGRSNLVGKPLALLLLRRNATVEICHSKTSNLTFETRQADILISAVGKPNLIKAEHVKKGTIVVDVGTTKDEKSNKLVGDVDSKSIEGIAKARTPVPGGVGLLTVACLFENLVEATERQMLKFASHGEK